MAERQFDLRIRVKADDEASGILGSISGGLQKLGTIALAGIGAVGAGVAYIASQAIPAASDLNESLNASSVVFGEAAGIIKDFGKTAASSVGMSEAAFNQLAAQTGSMLQNYGLDANEAANATIDLGKRAADMASIFNTDVDDAMTAINAAMRGEADPIERFGVSMSMAKVEAQALAMGFEKVDGQFNQTALTQARLALLMDQTSSIAGDFANTSDQLANATRVNEARWANFMATIGKLGLPIMTTFQSVLMDVGDVALPMIEGAVNNILPYVTDFAKGFQHIADVFLAGNINNYVDEFGGVLGVLADSFFDLNRDQTMFVYQIDQFLGKVGEALGPVIDWVTQNISLNDVLVGLGAAIGSVIIPIIGSLLTTIAPILLIFGAVVLAVSLLRQAWETDFGGIRTALTDVWENKLVPAFKYFQEELMPRVNRIIQYFGDLWELRIVPLLDKLGIKMGDGDGLGGIIGDVLGGAIDLVMMAIEGWIIIIEKMAPTITAWVDGISDAVDTFKDMWNWIGRVGDSLTHLRLPDWLTPGSPTPLELGVRGITDAMGELAREQLPSLSRGFGIANPLQPGLAGAGAAGGGGGEMIRLEIPVVLDGREVGHAAYEGTLDAMRQRGHKFRSTG